MDGNLTDVLQCGDFVAVREMGTSMKGIADNIKHTLRHGDVFVVVGREYDIQEHSTA